MNYQGVVRASYSLVKGYVSSELLLELSVSLEDWIWTLPLSCTNLGDWCRVTNWSWNSKSSFARMKWQVSMCVSPWCRFLLIFWPNAVRIFLPGRKYIHGKPPFFWCCSRSGSRRCRLESLFLVKETMQWLAKDLSAELQKKNHSKPKHKTPTRQNSTDT